MILLWVFLDFLFGNIIYIINVYEVIDDKGIEFILVKFLKILGKFKCFLLFCIIKLFLEWIGYGVIKFRFG